MKKQLYIAALTSYTDQVTDIVTGSSEALLLKELEKCFSNERTFNTKKDLEEYLAEYEDDEEDWKVEYKVVDLE
jgi:hypothetical protein